MTSIIHVATALIEDGQGRMLLVRKKGTHRFMQPGGKLEPGEDVWSALRRELLEEVGLSVFAEDARYLGQFQAAAANEAGTDVTADLFHICANHNPVISGEIAEAIWVSFEEALDLPIAPLTREIVLPIALRLNPSPVPSPEY